MAPKTISIIALSFSFLFLPFWVSLIIFLFSIFYFENFYGALIVLFLADLLYGFETVHLFNISGAMFFGGVLMFALSLFLKRFVFASR
jgi:hypothetical protein